MTVSYIYVHILLYILYYICTYIYTIIYSLRDRTDYRSTIIAFTHSESLMKVADCIHIISSHPDCHAGGNTITTSGTYEELKAKQLICQ